MYQSVQFYINKEKNKQTKCNTADQVGYETQLNVFLFWIAIDKRFFIQ